MPNISGADHKTLNLCVRTALQRAGVSGEALTEAVDDLMHALNALIDTGEDLQEFMPFIGMTLAQWKGKDAYRT